LRYDRLRILLVDDNHHMRQLLSEVLRSIGVREVFEANEGAEGVQMLREHPVDIVMTDLSMKGLEGLDFVRLVRSSGESPNQMVPIIVVTGHSTLQAVHQARDVGANEFLAKPITARGVIERVHQVIEHARPFVRTDSYFGPDRRRRADPDFDGPWRRSTDTPQQKAADDDA
jgi:CheY-like chemotaxis protein